MSINTPIKAGKKPLSQKPKGSYITAGEAFGTGNLELSQDLQAELELKGLVGHWINFQNTISRGMTHPRGWVPYVRDQKPTSGTIDLKFGTSPDGLIRRGDLVLGVKAKDKYDLHKAYLKQQASRQMNTQAKGAAELRQAAKDVGLDAKVTEGYDENE